jgi:hypothetical protein
MTLKLAHQETRMPKALHKLCLLSVMTLAVVFAILSGSRTAAASQPCLIKHFGCPPEFIDCCCGTRFICAGSFSQCQSFCGN